MKSTILATIITIISGCNTSKMENSENSKKWKIVRVVKEWKIVRIVTWQVMTARN